MIIFAPVNQIIMLHKILDNFFNHAINANNEIVDTTLNITVYHQMVVAI